MIGSSRRPSLHWCLSMISLLRRRAHLVRKIWNTDTRIMTSQKRLSYFSMDSSENALLNSECKRAIYTDFHSVLGENLLALPCSLLDFHAHHETVS